MTDPLHRHRRTLIMLARFVEEHIEVPGPPVAGVILFIDPKGLTVAETTVRDDSGPLNASVRFLNAKGNETTPDDTPVWTSSDENVATVEASEDGLLAVVTPTGQVGATLIAVESVESETGETIRAQGTVTVEPSTVAVSGEVSFEEQEEPGPDEPDQPPEPEPDQPPEPSES